MSDEKTFEAMIETMKEAVALKARIDSGELLLIEAEKLNTLLWPFYHVAKVEAKVETPNEKEGATTPSPLNWEYRPPELAPTAGNPDIENNHILTKDETNEEPMSLDEAKKVMIITAIAVLLMFIAYWGGALKFGPLW